MDQGQLRRDERTLLIEALSPLPTALVGQEDRNVACKQKTTHSKTGLLIMPDGWREDQIFFTGNTNIHRLCTNKDREMRNTGSGKGEIVGGRWGRGGRRHGSCPRG